MLTNDPEEGRPFSFSLLVEVNSIRNGLSTYVELSQEVEAMLDQKENELGAKLSAELERAPENAHQDIHEDYALDLRDYESTFRYLQREAMFLTLYNYFEHFLNTLCEWIGEEIKSRIKLGDIQGKGITRALLFLDRIPEFRFDKIPEAMTTIRGSNQLRNIIVHAGAVLPPDANASVNQFVKMHSHLSGKPGHSVALDATFVSGFADTLRTFFDEFDAQMQAYMDRTWRSAADE